EHDHVVGQGIADLGIEPERLLAARHQLRGRQRVAAREQGDLVTLPDQLLGQIGDDSLRAAVEAGWNAFDQGCDLRDSHLLVPSILCPPRGRARGNAQEVRSAPLSMSSPFFPGRLTAETPPRATPTWAWRRRIQEVGIARSGGWSAGDLRNRPES